MVADVEKERAQAAHDDEDRDHQLLDDEDDAVTHDQHFDLALGHITKRVGEQDRLAERRAPGPLLRRRQQQLGGIVVGETHLGKD